jgi:hypothetical protein
MDTGSSEDAEFKEMLIASTRLDAHGYLITEQALQELAAQIHEQPIRMTTEHDRTQPPWGRMAAARVIRAEDGELELWGRPERLVEEGLLTLPDGAACYSVFGFPGDNRPLAAKSRADPNVLHLEYDPVNFESPEASLLYVMELKDVANFESSLISRKSMIPDPLLIVQLPAVIVIGDLARRIVAKVGDRVGEAVGDDVTRIYLFATRAPIRLLQLARPKGGPVTCIYEVHDGLSVSFAVRGNDARTFEQAVDLERFRELYGRAQELRDSLAATEVQYLYSGERGWELNYLITASGTVIGKRVANPSTVPVSLHQNEGYVPSLELDSIEFEQDDKQES